MNISKELTSHIKIFDFRFSGFVCNPLVVYDEVVRDGELVVRVPAQQRVVDLILTNSELVTHLRYRFRVYHTAVLYHTISSYEIYVYGNNYLCLKSMLIDGNIRYIRL